MVEAWWSPGGIEHVEEVLSIGGDQVERTSIDQQSLHSHQAAPKALFLRKRLFKRRDLSIFHQVKFAE